MRVLLTNNTLHFRAGSELYIRDLAIELMRRGHHPIAYSTQLGDVAEELRAATVPVIESLESLGAPPDIIHGHHHYETLTAILRFPNVPAIYYCHGWIPWQEAPLHSPRILRYVAVDEVCRERLITEGGIAPEKIDLSLNFFDQRFFPARTPLPSRPRQALAFGHSFREHEDLPILREACLRCGVELHAAGLGSGNEEAHPGRRFAQYDVVFAKARAAIEAMAAGTAVVLCGYGKLGPMVTTENFDSLRMLNFGVRALSRPLDPERVVAELQEYDPKDATDVSRLTRQHCELQPAVDRIVELYSRVIEEARQSPVTSIVEENRAAARYLEQWGARYKQGPELGPDRQRWIERCETAERSLGERDSQLLEVEGDRRRWMERFEAAERFLGERDSRLRDIEEDRRRWMERCEAVERSSGERDLRLRELEEDRRRWMERCAAAEAALLEQQTTARTIELERQSCEDRLAKSEVNSVLLEREITALRASATWRWSQQVLRNTLVQALFGRFIHAAAQRSKPIHSSVQARAEEMISRHGFLGVPIETFEQAGRSQLTALLKEGLKPESKVLDIGCGCLRAGCRLIRFLDPGCYHGIEPARQRVECGLRYLFTPEEVILKRPRFDFNPHFDSSAFGVRFDFFLARSIWTHASKRQIEAMLDAFLRDAASGGIFLASYLPAQSADDDYQGDGWVGTSHESDTPSVIRHSLTWIVLKCQRRALQVTELPGVDCDGQLWLRIQRT